MTKSVIATLLVVVMLICCTYATAEDLTGMSTDELLDLRLRINDELAARYEPPVLKDGMTLIDIFPDKNFAIYIRDQVGAFSINEQVTQEDLSRVTTLFLNDESYGITSFEGLQYLTGVKRITCLYQKGLTELPDCFDSLTVLWELDMRNCGITELPPSICNSPSLECLYVSNTNLEKLPEDIGNIQTLKKLNISNTKITELPASIRLLKLEEFNRKGLDLGD